MMYCRRAKAVSCPWRSAVMSVIRHNTRPSPCGSGDTDSLIQRAPSGDAPGTDELAGSRTSRDIARAEIKFDEAVTGIATGELVNAHKQGEYAIYFRGYKANEGIIEADVRSVDAQQLEIVSRRIAEVLNKEKTA